MPPPAPGGIIKIWSTDDAMIATIIISITIIIITTCIMNIWSTDDAMTVARVARPLNSIAKKITA